MLMDIDPNQKDSGNTLVVEGKVEISDTLKRRISRKGGRSSSKKSSNPVKQEGTDLGVCEGDKTATLRVESKDVSMGKPLIRCENENGFLVQVNKQQQQHQQQQHQQQQQQQQQQERAADGNQIIVEPSQKTREEEEDENGTVLRNSTASTDSGIAEENDRDLASHGISTENSPTEMSIRNHLAPPASLTSVGSKGSFDSFRFQTRDRRDSMLLSQLCVVAVTIPADIIRGQKGKGAMLKFRFSPYTQIEALRVAILKVCQLLWLNYLYILFQSLCLSAYLSIYLSVYLSVCLLIHLLVCFVHV